MRVSVLAALAALSAAPTYAFEINAYDGINCGGEPKLINVYDNTCAAPYNFGSFYVVAYGGQGQVGRFFSSEDCSDGNYLAVAVGTASPSWKIGGTCQTFGTGNNIRSMSSHTS